MRFARVMVPALGGEPAGFSVTLPDGSVVRGADPVALAASFEGHLAVGGKSGRWVHWGTASTALLCAQREWLPLLEVRALILFWQGRLISMSTPAEI